MIQKVVVNILQDFLVKLHISVRRSLLSTTWSIRSLILFLPLCSQIQIAQAPIAMGRACPVRATRACRTASVRVMSVCASWRPCAMTTSNWCCLGWGLVSRVTVVIHMSAQTNQVNIQNYVFFQFFPLPFFQFMNRLYHQWPKDCHQLQHSFDPYCTLIKLSLIKA